MKRRISVGLLFASPWLVGMVVFRFYPIGASIYNSFTEFDIVTPPFFVGLENYVSLLRDEVFWVSLQNTIYLFLIGLPVTVAVALLVAMLLKLALNARGVLREQELAAARGVLAAPSQQR